MTDHMAKFDTVMASDWLKPAPTKAHSVPTMKTGRACLCEPFSESKTWSTSYTHDCANLDGLILQVPEQKSKLLVISGGKDIKTTSCDLCIKHEKNAFSICPTRPRKDTKSSISTLPSIYQEWSGTTQ